MALATVEGIAVRGVLIIKTADQSRKSKSANRLSWPERMYVLGTRPQLPNWERRSGNRQPCNMRPTTAPFGTQKWDPAALQYNGRMRWQNFSHKSGCSSHNEEAKPVIVCAQAPDTQNMHRTMQKIGMCSCMRAELAHKVAASAARLGKADHPNSNCFPASVI